MFRILIVDDEEINRLSLEAGFADMYEIVHASNGKEALEILYLDESIQAVLLDLNMPELDGMEVLKQLNETGLIHNLPVFIITSSNDNEELLKAYELGAVDVISKSYNIKFLRRRVANTIELYTQRNHLSKIVEEKTSELIRQNNRLVEAMADVVEFRSNESGTHVKRVSGYTKIIMEGIIRENPEYEYLANDIESISFAACLHDLGKIAIPDHILNKPGKYTQEEFDVMKTHSLHGYKQILSLEDIMEPRLFNYCLDICRHHHERYDGKGYPDKLKGNEITIWSQAVALADVYDALTSDRCYKDAYSHEKACEMIINGECGVFNPKVLEVFKQLSEKFYKFSNEAIRKKILIIDDSSIDRSIVFNMLSDDFDIEQLETGPDAVLHLGNKSNKYDAVIIDVNMPGMDGFELLKILGHDFVVHNSIIMCSVEVNSETIRKALSCGVRAFLKKPFDSELVKDKLKKITGAA